MLHQQLLGWQVLYLPYNIDIRCWERVSWRFQSKLQWWDWSLDSQYWFSLELWVLIGHDHSKPMLDWKQFLVSETSPWRTCSNVYSSLSSTWRPSLLSWVMSSAQSSVRWKFITNLLMYLMWSTLSRIFCPPLFLVGWCLHEITTHHWILLFVLTFTL